MIKKIKWGTIIPLIGGMPVANKAVTNVDPSFILSYDAFAANDSYAVNYFKDVPYHVIDSSTNKLDINSSSLFNSVDFVSSTCPCAGLSMLNSSNSGGLTSRGGNAIQNQWLYKSSEFVLENIKPKVLWGENAPNLYTDAGKDVVYKLKEIGDKYNYSLSIIKTDTYLHGIPQHRQRTFYFFWNSETAPFLNYYKKETPHIIDYLKEIPATASRLNDPIVSEKYTDDAFYKYLTHKGINIRGIKNKTLLSYVIENDLVDDIIKWSDNSEDKMIIRCNKRMKHYKNKVAQGMGVWDSSPCVLGDSINALISKNSFNIHPTEDRYLNMREALHLMGLPHDFVYDGGFQTATQNVPVKTASDMTREVIKFVNNELQFSDSKFIKQNNRSQKVDFKFSVPTEYKTIELF